MKHLLSFYFLLVISTINLLAQKGLKADYFDGTQFNHYVATEYVDKIDFYWNNTPPVPGINPHKCSVRYTGRLKAPKTGEYTFSARVDDGVRVWVGDIQVINNWRLNDVGYSKGKVKMEAGQFYDLKIEYFNALIEAELRLLWKLPEKEDVVVAERSWFDKWWYGEENKAVIIPAEYFASPFEKIAEANPEPAQLPIVKIEPTPKPKRKPKPKIVKPKSLPIPKKKKVVDTIQQYIPKNVAFNRKEAEILAVSFRELDKLANFLVSNPTQKVRIEGHTDNVGDMEKNLRLSERRAYAVAAYLVKKGVSPNQLSAKGFGGTMPLVQSDGKKYHPENRRVAFIIE